MTPGSPVSEEVKARLASLGIGFEVTEHEPIYTTEEGAAIAERTGSLCCKNLFLRTKKKEFFLLIMPAVKRFDTKALASQIGCSRLSFASEDEMRELLHTYPGAVTPLGLMFDAENRVQAVVDRDVLRSPFIDCHPCRNDQTLKIAVKDLLEKFIPSCGHVLIFAEL